MHFSEFLPYCRELESKVKPLLGYSAQDLGLVLRGFTFYSFILYVQNPSDEDYDNHNTHDSSL